MSHLCAPISVDPHLKYSFPPTGVDIQAAATIATCGSLEHQSDLHVPTSSFLSETSSFASPPAIASPVALRLPPTASTFVEVASGVHPCSGISVYLADLAVIITRPASSPLLAGLLPLDGVLSPKNFWVSVQISCECARFVATTSTLSLVRVSRKEEKGSLGTARWNDGWNMTIEEETEEPKSNAPKARIMFQVMKHQPVRPMVCLGSATIDLQTIPLGGFTRCQTSFEGGHLGAILRVQPLRHPNPSLPIPEIKSMIENSPKNKRRKPVFVALRLLCPCVAPV